MSAFLKKYIWLWEMIACAIAISCGIIIVTVKPVLYLIIGFILAILGLFRIIPLVKTTDDKLMKWFNAIELIINILVGGMLIYLGFVCNKEGNETLNEFIDKNFGYFIGGIFYLRGFIYFFTTVIRREESNLILFFIHIALFTLGTFLIALTIKQGFEYESAQWTLFAIALLAAGFTGYNGVKGYINYRGNEQNEKATKKIKKVAEETENKIEAPSDEAIIDQVNVNIDKSDEIVDEVPTIQA